MLFTVRRVHLLTLPTLGFLDLTITGGGQTRGSKSRMEVPIITFWELYIFKSIFYPFSTKILPVFKYGSNIAFF